MKTTLFTIVFGVFLISCHTKPENQVKKSEQQIKEVGTQKNNLPKSLEKVLEAHGGLERYKTQNTLSFTLPKPDNPELHIIDLKHRKDRIETPKYDLGFDGEKVWTLAKEEAFSGNPEFYHNLMFYFFNMPFVLADKGIIYSHTNDLIVNEKNYPGIAIQFKDGVGASSKDQYYLHYDPNTYKMEWLGYTVTYRTGEVSDKVSWIHYKEWANVNHFLLPKAISWHKTEGGNIQEERNTVVFESITISEAKKPNSFYKKPNDGIFWVKPE